MKNQKGVTLLLLVLTFIVMGLLIGSVTYNSTYSLKMSNYYNMYADIELLDEKIAIYYLQNKDEVEIENQLPINKTETKLIGDLIENYEEGNVNYNPNNSGILYKIDLSKFDEELTLNNKDYYIDKDSHTIYFEYDITIDGVKYYTVPVNYTEVPENI